MRISHLMVLYHLKRQSPYRNAFKNKLAHSRSLCVSTSGRLTANDADNSLWWAKVLCSCTLAFDLIVASDEHTWSVVGDYVRDAEWVVGWHIGACARHINRVLSVGSADESDVDGLVRLADWAFVLVAGREVSGTRRSESNGNEKSGENGLGKHFFLSRSVLSLLKKVEVE